MGSNILYRNVHTGPRQGKEPGPIVSYGADPVPCTCPGPGPVQCEKAITERLGGGGGGDALITHNQMVVYEL